MFSKTRLSLLILALPWLCSAAHDMRRFDLNSGAATMDSARYDLQASVGQVDASASTTAADLQLTGGFWHPNTDLIFKDNLE